MRVAATIAAGLLGISATSLPVVAGDASVTADAPSAGSITSSALTAFSLEFDPVGTIGSLGVEWTYTGDWSDSAFGYDVYMRWDSSGRWFTWETDTSSLNYGRPTGYHSGPLYDPAAAIVRIEFYPHDADGCSGDDPEQDCYWEVYDPFDENHGGIAIQIEREGDALPSDLGSVHLATPGDAWEASPSSVRWSTTGRSQTAASASTPSKFRARGMRPAPRCRRTPRERVSGPSEPSPPPATPGRRPSAGPVATRSSSPTTTGRRYPGVRRSRSGFGPRYRSRCPVLRPRSMRRVDRVLRGLSTGRHLPSNSADTRARHENRTRYPQWRGARR